MRKFNAKITYTIDEQHPDSKCIKDFSKSQIFSFEDIYTFEDYYTYNEIIDYIKKDLKLVAGGGYNTDHIHNISFEITGML